MKSWILTFAVALVGALQVACAPDKDKDQDKHIKKATSVTREEFLRLFDLDEWNLARMAQDNRLGDCVVLEEGADDPNYVIVIRGEMVYPTLLPNNAHNRETKGFSSRFKAGQWLREALAEGFCFPNHRGTK